MNTYTKFCPNVYIAKCTEKHSKGDIINVTTKYGKENESIVHNFLGEKNDFFFYSITRADGFNNQEYAKKKAEKLKSASLRADRKSTEYYNRSNQHQDFLSMGEPIKVGHHSEKRHRKLYEDAHRNMSKSVELSEVSDNYMSRADYWKSKENDINLSMPESIEYYKYKLEQAIKEHQDLKSGIKQRSHSYSLTYAKKEVNKMTKNLKLAQRLWG